MTLRVYTHPSSPLHVTPPGHPERVARIETVDRVLAEDRVSEREYAVTVSRPSSVAGLQRLRLGPRSYSSPRPAPSV